MNTAVQRNKLRTQLWRMLAGAVVGAVSTLLFLEFVAEGHMDLHDPAIMLATVAGLVYALMGLSVGFGILAPGAGARFLNVEDADELREEGPKLKIAAAACIVMGAFLLLLALTATGTLMSREAALAALLGCLAIAAVLAVVSRKRTDEMTRQIGLEASAFTLQVALLGLAGWAVLTQLGYVGWISPLGLVSGLALVQLAAIFVISARRGLLVR